MFIFNLHIHNLIILYLSHIALALPGTTEMIVILVIVLVLFGGNKIPALGIWAQVPHYVTAMSYPASSVALLDGLEEATGIAIAGPALRNEVDIQRQRIDRMVRDNDDHGVMVRQLEALHDAAVQDEADAAETTAEMRMKSGDEIAEEIQEFLRNQD